MQNAWNWVDIWLMATLVTSFSFIGDRGWENSGFPPLLSHHTLPSPWKMWG